MKKIIHIVLLSLLIVSGAISSVAAYEDADRDRVQDDAVEDDRRDKDTNTLTENIRYICTAQDIGRHLSASTGFVAYGCNDYEVLGVFSQLKKDSLSDTDKDGVNDLEDVDDTTSDENSRFICRSFDIDRQLFSDCQSGDLWRFSQAKKDKNFDSDRDGVKDFEDRERNTSEANRRYVCTMSDIRDEKLSILYGCLNDSVLWVFSITKKSYLWGDSSSPSSLIWVPGGVTVDGPNITNGGINLDTGNKKSGTDRNDPLNELRENNDGFWVTDRSGEEGIYNLLVAIARDLKNIFFAFATIFFLYIVIRLIFSESSEEDVQKFKKWLLWITIGIVIMQLAFSFVSVLYDRWFGESLGSNLITNIVNPMITLLETLAAFFFVTMGVVAFYQLITSNGNEEAATNAKSTLLNALLWYLLVKIARFLVDSVYTKSETLTLDGFSNVIITIINWMNGFVAIVVIIMILYTWAQVLLSGGEEEKLTNAKKSLIYIVIGIVLLLINFLILTFFFRAGI